MSTAPKSAAECRKFSPNIFNRSKCQHCFASKDSHSAEALDSNRVSRKVSKCGYLFVAPDWDFTNPINRTKRWQRRWFVLYDDGELTYSVDEHPETVPQAIIDMTKVLEVSNAEDVTGNQYSIAITAPEKVHFIKGTSREESQWWFHELAIFPRSIKNSRYKRNATFPGGKASTMNKVVQLSTHAEEVAHFRSDSQLSRPRFFSCDGPTSDKDSLLSPTTISLKNSYDCLPEIEIIESSTDKEKMKSNNKPQESNAESEQVKNTSMKVNEKVRSRHSMKRDQRLVSNTRSHSDSIGQMIPQSFEDTNKPLRRLKKNKGGSVQATNESLDIIILDKLKSKLHSELGDNPEVFSSRQQYHNDKNLEITRQLSENDSKDDDNSDFSISYIKPSLDSNQNYYIPVSDNIERQTLYVKPLTTNEDSNNSESPTTVSKPGDSMATDNGLFSQPVHARGDPDGCGLDNTHSSHCSYLCEKDIHHSVVSVKKGWLMLQNDREDWSKHWFVLQKGILKFYSDLLAEENKKVEGLIMLVEIQSVLEAEASRNYGFAVQLKNGKKYMLSALTCGIRNNWIQAIRDTADLKSPVNLVVKSTEKEVVIKQKGDLNHEEQSHAPLDSVSSPLSGLSSDDEFKTASETSGRTEDYFEWVDEDGDHTSTSRALPPSPPLNRTPISRVKERARTRSNTRTTCEKSEKTRTETKLAYNKDDVVKDDLSGSDRENFSSVEALKMRKYTGQKENLSKNVASDVPESMLVESLESEVESLRSQLEQVQKNLHNQRKVSSSVTTEREHRSRAMSKDTAKDEMLISNLQRKVSALENQITDLVKEIEKKNEELAKKNFELLKLEESHEDLNKKMQSRIDSETTNMNTWEEHEKCTRFLEDRLATSESKIGDLMSEMEKFHQVHDVQAASLKTLLKEREKENEMLKADLQKMSSQVHSASPDCNSDMEQGSSHLSLPTSEAEDFSKDDKNYQHRQESETETLSKSENDDDLERKLLRATTKIRTLRKELQEAHRVSDDMELACIKLQQQAKSVEDDYSAQIAMMTVRIEDLTNKLSNAEKTNRQLKQKLARQEGKERRKSSLKGKEAFVVSKELETKVCDLEKKLKIVERVLSVNGNLEKSAGDQIDGTSATMTTTPDSLQLLVRINSLESKVKDASDKLQVIKMPKVPECDNEDDVLVEKETNGSLNLNTIIDECSQLAEQHRELCQCGLAEEWQKVCRVLGTIKKEVQNCGWSPSSVDKQNIQQTLVNFRNLLQKRDFQWEEKLALSKQFGTNNTKIVNGMWVEKILGNAIILGKMTCLLRELTQRDCITQLRNAKGCYRRMALLEKKLLRLLKLKPDTNDSDNSVSEISSLNLYVSKMVVDMEKKEKVVESLMDQYKLNNFKVLADALAYKTLKRQMLNETTKHDEMQETGNAKMSSMLSQKLMEAEMHRVVTRFSKFHENEVLLDLEVNGIIGDTKDEHFNTVKKYLSADMNDMLKELQLAYHTSLTKLQLVNSDKMDVENVTSNLAEFVNLIAQNALVRGHLNYFRESFAERSKSLDDSEVTKETIPLISDIIDKELEALYVEQETCTSKTPSGDLLDFSPMPAKRNESSLNRYSSVQDILEKSTDGKPSYFLRSYEARLQRSFRQRGQRSVTMPICIDTTSTATEKKPCTNCNKLHEEIKAAKEIHALALKEVEEKHEHDLNALEAKFKMEMLEMQKNYEEKILTLQERNAALEKKQMLQKEEFDQELKALKDSYEQEVVRKTDTKINEEAIRQRYQAEIEQLRGLCERGLIAMENSHRRIISELEQKHCHELEQLHVEKEQALAEETQATLAALDAMRKAHEAELQREIAKFKEEFLHKMHVNHEINVIHKEHGDELETIKDEILSLSEKYSIKCLENASLEERLEPIMQQLTDANTQIFSLTTRNKQLRAALEQRSEKIQKGLEKIVSTESGSDLKSLQLKLQLKENELLSKEEMIEELRHELEKLRYHKQELDEHCRLLDQSLKAERQLREDEVSTLRDRLEHFFLSGNLSFEDSSVCLPYSQDESFNKFVAGSKEKSQRVERTFPELIRSPSCPGLSKSDLFSPSIFRSRIQSVSSPVRRFSTPMKH